MEMMSSIRPVLQTVQIARRLRFQYGNPDIPGRRLGEMTSICILVSRNETVAPDLETDVYRLVGEVLYLVLKFSSGVYSVSVRSLAGTTALPNRS